MFKDREKRSIWEETSLLDAVEDRRVIRVNLLNKFFPFFRTDADVGLSGRLQHRYRLVTHLFIFIKVLIRVFFSNFH